MPTPAHRRRAHAARGLNRRCVLGSCAVIVSPLLRAQTEAWPTRPVKFVVPFPAGGTADVVARLFAEAMGRYLGQGVVIDNRPGAGTTIGADLVARAHPDGHTLLFSTSSPITVAPHFQKVGYRAEQDFEPVALVGDTPMMFVAATREGAPRSMRELLERIRMQPGRVTAALTGNGTVGHLAMELLRHRGALDFQLVPYKGISEAYADIMAGRIDFGVDAPPSGMPHLRSGQLRALAVTSAARNAALPEVPTVAESGVAGYDIGFWIGLLGPRGMPAPVGRRLAELAFRCAEEPQLAARLSALGIERRKLAGPAFLQLIADENTRWSQLVKATGATLR
jgi:tripartite-type tricarboxylate transporter receptor subunit TctC